MLGKAYEAQCEAAKVHCINPAAQARRSATLFALALGTFCIGTSEFASMGIIQLFAHSLRVDIPTATSAITAYAFGVVVGAPLVTLLAARLNRKTLLLGLMGLFAVGNLLSAAAANLQMLSVARFIAGMPQGAYFGAGAVVAAYIVGPGKGGKAFSLVMSGLTIATIVGSPPWATPRLAQYLHRSGRCGIGCIGGIVALGTAD
jgi:MFS transporter, DHA1 family, inner membrane transport protein